MPNISNSFTILFSSAHVRIKQLTRVVLYDNNTADYSEEVMRESSENVSCVAWLQCLALIGLRGRIMTQHLVKGAAMTSS